jgi:ribose 5-phosphate isomerase A
MSTSPQEFAGIAQRALTLVPDGAVVGLGTGHAASAFIHALGERVRAGLKIRGVPTSVASAELATQLGIPLVSLANVEAIDVDVDGADEVDPHCNLIKGLGGALVREKIVAASSRKVVILVGPEKLVPVLGSHGTLPVEVTPFGVPLCRRRLAVLGCTPHLRLAGQAPFVSDNGNHILDCHVPPINRPNELDEAIRAIPGVAGTGFFLGMADTVLIQNGPAVEVRTCTRR